MLISKQELLKDAREQGYKPEILEKVYHLLDIFRKILAITYLKERLVLKGGTALNLFCFDSVKRLSVDIDVNYIGSVDRKTMLDERVILNDAISNVLQTNGFEKYRAPNQHAGAKLVWLYNSLLGSKGTLEIDINYMYRMPLWPVVYRNSKISGYDGWLAPTLDIHELAAGKLSALFARRASRDLFDVHHLLNNTQLDFEKLKIAFTVYVAMTKINVNDLVPVFIEYDVKDMRNRLLPVLYQNDLPRAIPQLKVWSQNLLQDLRQGLNKLLPLGDHQIEFINNIREFGSIKPNLLTKDHELANKISLQPGLLWAAKSSRDH